MAQIKKNDLIALIRSFGKIIESSKKELNIDILTDCQNQVVDFGNYIENFYKEIDSKPIIQKLELFCELLYQTCISQKEEQQKYLKKLSKLLITLENDIKYILPQDKKSVVFLPYKASMWDSLESIYLSFIEDANYETYVIPIPYFDKNADGSFGEIHYEGNEYPNNIPITSWRDYSIKENQPDIIYIHNPYDSCNYVTSVHPNYYASELSKYTKELVYVPYFVLNEISPNEQNVIDGMKHFITTPGVIYADKVIVQSENMKKIYVNEYIKFAKEVGLEGIHQDRNYQESRIIGSGSPKFERIRRIKKEDVTIPDEWLKLICKSDETWKKIIFYNTSITALLNNKADWIAKIENTLTIFEQYKNSIVLLWRPHPLLENTIHTMTPDIYDKYIEIRDKYLSQGWGIYDDTADLNRAIAISDAYYGDESSLVQLFKDQKKPIMIQNISYLSN